MGIVNVTPDSFSDGGRFLKADVAIAHGLRLVSEGADIIDVGGESSRPNAAPVPESEELQRVLPVIEGLADETLVPISIDTTKPNVAREALEAGASIVNDIAANRSDSIMWRVVAEAGAGYVCMHMRGTPQTMQANPVYEDVVQEVRDFFFRADSAIAGLRNRARPTYIGPWDRFWKNARSQSGTASFGAWVFGVRAAAAPGNLTKVVYG
jgi:dihydropteroate synthase